MVPSGGDSEARLRWRIKPLVSFYRYATQKRRAMRRGTMGRFFIAAKTGGVVRAVGRSIARMNYLDASGVLRM